MRQFRIGKTFTIIGDCVNLRLVLLELRLECLVFLQPLDLGFQIGHLSEVGLSFKSLHLFCDPSLSL
jgi:hypothetical protein